MVFGILDAKHWPSSDLLDSLACFSVQKLRRTSYGARAPGASMIKPNIFRVRGWRTLSWKEGLDLQLGRLPACQSLLK